MTRSRWKIAAPLLFVGGLVAVLMLSRAPAESRQTASSPAGVPVPERPVATPPAVAGPPQPRRAAPPRLQAASPQWQDHLRYQSELLPPVAAVLGLPAATTAALTE